MFDTRRAVFEPADARSLERATKLAINQLGDDVLMPATKVKLGKVIVAIAKARLRKGDDLNPADIAKEAAIFIRQLRSLLLLP